MNRQRLLWLLSQMIERQLRPSIVGKEAGDDAGDSTE
jgi:hypothetical protein